MSTDDPFAVLGLDATADLDAVRTARRRLALELHPDRGGDPDAMRAVNVAFDRCVAHLTGRRPLPTSHSPEPGPSWTAAERDHPSFTIDALPAEAFEAILVVASWIGEVVDDDPPYRLECHLADPTPCWCRLDLVPDAGGSTVSIVVASSDAGTRVLAIAVRDTWVANLNRLRRLEQPMP